MFQNALLLCDRLDTIHNTANFPQNIEFTLAISLYFATFRFWHGSIFTHASGLMHIPKLHNHYKWGINVKGNNQACQLYINLNCGTFCKKFNITWYRTLLQVYPWLCMYASLLIHVYNIVYTTNYLFCTILAKCCIYAFVFYILCCCIFLWIGIKIEMK